ncbi:MAG: carbon starvation protein A [Bacteroidales bacterium]|nr:carbon starvation protein A [Bacteroidales bacterium]
MYSFIICVAALILGYIFYGKFVEKVFAPDPNRIPPCVSKADGMDYVPMPSWKIYMIQFLNIAGTGPIFGALMGAKFGPASYVWIVIGAIFAGAMHDYFAGMMSMRNGGEGLPDIIGRYLGGKARAVMLVFAMLLMLLVGAVFTSSPAIILGDLTKNWVPGDSVMVWCVIVFIYYMLATLLPISKLIGKIYPLFAIALIFMAVALMVVLVFKWPSIPEIWTGLSQTDHQLKADSGLVGQNLFPCLFITIACGALSGFHATQSPMMARCMTNEKLGRPIFYGAMITEGIIALIWAALGSYFVYGHGFEELGIAINSSAPLVVENISIKWLGIAGGVLAILGVVAAPITSGDTAFRTARLILADFVRVDQKSIPKRLAVSLPVFLAAGFFLYFSIADNDGFNLIWRYFMWANQILASFTLWAITVFLYRERKGLYYLMSLIPGIFMTSVCVTFICIMPIGFGISDAYTAHIGIATALVCTVLFAFFHPKRNFNG